MRLGPAASLFASVLALLACNDDPDTPPSNDSGSGTSTSTGTSSTGPVVPGDSTTASVDDTIGTGSASSSATDSSTTSAVDDTSSGGSSSSGPAESSESTGTPPPINGCADGEREALEDEVVYPDIAACSGGFTVPGVVVNVPYCDRAGGDDGLEPNGEGCSIEDLCSEGWHVCASRMEVMAAGVASCGAEAFGGAFFATRQSGEGMDACANTGVNDVFGCGDVGHTMIVGCAPLNRSTANGCNALPEPWSCNTSLSQEAEFLIKEGPEFGGVLCCRD